MLFLSCCVLALLSFHAAFLSGAIGRSVVVPLVAALGFSVVAGGYAWPPIANKTASLEAAELAGWSERRARQTLIGINVLAFSLILSGVLFLFECLGR